MNAREHPPAEDTTGIESTEALREALFTLQHENELLQQGSVQAQTLLDALESLLGNEADDEPFSRVIAALRKVFGFRHALMLVEAEAAQLECIVADPPLLQGTVWLAGPLFSKVMGGKVVATFPGTQPGAGTEEWTRAAQHPGPAGTWLREAARCAALHVPVRAREQRGVLVLLRGPGEAGFGRSDTALARRFSLLVSHALASRSASRSEAEGRRLRELTTQLRHSEQTTRRSAELLQTVLSVLPVGVVVQASGGQLLLSNDAAASAIGHSLQQPIRSYRSLDAELRRRLRAFQAGLRVGEQRSGEFPLRQQGRERTLMVTVKRVRLLDEELLLWTALDISERKLLEQDLSRRAFHDPLTDLPNRARMHEIVSNALRHAANTPGHGLFALAFIDLDNFKQINDYYSHALGDALLKAVAQRVTHHIRATDTLARISGDEFLLLINPLVRAEDLPPLINRVIEALKQPFQIEGHELMISASMGASLYPLHGHTYEALCRCADGAMYRAKRDRKGSASYFDASMGQALTARMETEQRLRLAIREQRFRVAYQPKVGLADGRVLGLEALVRWVEPDGSVHMPDSFIELASELGLLDRITACVVGAVAEHLPALQARFGASLSVSINLSARQAGDMVFMDQLIDDLARFGLGPHLVLEVTEDALLATQRFVREVLPRLREHQLRLSIDDFGTGYSSLATLAEMTVDEVKVDRSLISAIHERPRSQGILRAIESLCAGLGTELVAEGVETAEELHYLRTHSRIVVAQGFHFAAPMLLEPLLAWPGHGQALAASPTAATPEA